jgi:glycosyltransferase involved in cell wall biosynthesis
MKIIQATKAYSPHIGGVETVVKQLAESFAKKDNIESNVTVCNDLGHSSSEISNGVHINRTATYARIASLPISPGYPCQLLSQSADILHIHEPFLIAPAAYLAVRSLARKRFKRLVVWWHSDIVKQESISSLYLPIQKAILAEAHAIIVATPNHISSSKVLGEFKHKCHVIHFGVDLSRFQITPDCQQKIDAIKEKYQKPIILFFGRLIYYKGAEYLVEAMNSIPEAHLVVVGKGALRESLELMASKGINNISFIPYLSEEDLVAMYHACEIFVLPSVENTEAFGIVQLEAMACGKPVISSDLPTGVTYVNQDGVTGLVVKKRSSQELVTAIKYLLENEKIRQELGNTAKRRVESDFTVSGMVEQTLNLYNEILSK